MAVDSILLVSKPYQQRRAYATCKKLWPELKVISTAQPLPLPDYIANLGDCSRVINMLVGETQRVIEYPKLGHTVEQDVPSDVRQAYTNLVNAGYTERLIPQDND